MSYGSREQLGKEISAAFNEDPILNPTGDDVARIVMPFVNELFARARCMREAAEQMARNVESLTAELAAKEAERARLRKLYSDALHELNLLHNAYDGDADDEVFCDRCAAGIDSSEHHAKCVVTGHALDGESASPLGVEGGAVAARSTDRAMQRQEETNEFVESFGAEIPQAVIDNNPAVAVMLGFVQNYQPGDLQRALRTERERG